MQQTKRERECVRSKLAFMVVATVCFSCLILAILPMLLSQRRISTFMCKLPSPFSSLLSIFSQFNSIHWSNFCFCFYLYFSLPPLWFDFIWFVVVLLEHMNIKFVDHGVFFFFFFCIVLAMIFYFIEKKKYFFFCWVPFCLIWKIMIDVYVELCMNTLQMFNFCCLWCHLFFYFFIFYCWVQFCHMEKFGFWLHGHVCCLFFVVLGGHFHKFGQFCVLIDSLIPVLNSCTHGLKISCLLLLIGLCCFLKDCGFCGIQLGLEY